MFWLFSSDLSLYIFSFLQLKDICTLYLLSHDIHQFLHQHEATIYHQLAVSHHFITAGTSLEDAVLAEQTRVGWLDGTETWKELCRRWIVMDHNWAGRGSVQEGGYLTFEGDVRLFQIDESERTILAVTEISFKKVLTVRAVEDGRLLWSLADVYGLDYSDGFILLFRNNSGIEIWRRASDVNRLVKDGVPVTTPLGKPSPLAATPSQLEKARSLSIGSGADDSLRGRYVPHGFLPSFSGAPFRDSCFKYPILAAIDREAPHVAQLYNVAEGVFLRAVDLDALAKGCSLSRQQPWSSGDALLLDIDISGDYLCATFHAGVLVTTLYDEEDSTQPSSRLRTTGTGEVVTSSVLFDEDFGPFEARQIAHRLEKGATPNRTESEGAKLFSGDASLASVSGIDALERYAAVSSAEKDSNPESLPLVRAGHWRTSGFISAKFSPDGRHIVAGTVFGLLLLFSDFARIFRGLSTVPENIQRLDVGEPLRDIIWETDNRRIAFRTEPGDMFIADLDPKHHSNLEDASGSRMRLEDALFHRLRDFSSLYGMAFGNMHMRKTGFWFVWDVAKLHEDIRERVKSQGQYITYGSDGKKPQIGSGKVITVCFIEFTNNVIDKVV